MTITTSKFEKAFLREQVLAIHATRILEIGAFKGETTEVLSRAAGETGGRVMVIDPMKWASKPAHFWEWIDGLLHPFSYEPTFWKNVRKSGHDNVRVFHALSTDAPLIANPDPDLAEFDLIFIDGEHIRETVLADVKNWGGRVRVKGKILLHDVIPRFPGVVDVVRDLDRDPRYQVTWPKKDSIAMVDVVSRQDAAQASPGAPAHAANGSSLVSA